MDTIFLTLPQRIINLLFTMNKEDICKLLKFNLLLSDEHLKPVLNSNDRKIKMYYELIKDIPGWWQEYLKG